MLALSVALLLLGASGETEVIKLAAPGLTSANLDDKLTAFYSDHLSQQVAYAGIRVTTARQLSEVLGFERQKAMMGCSDETTCLVEIGSALGVDGLLVGDLAKIGSSFQANLRVLSVQNGQVITAYSVRIDDEEDLIDELRSAAKRLSKDLSAKLGRPLIPPDDVAGETTAELTVAQKWSWVPLSVGALGAAGGTYLLFQAKKRHDTLVQRGGEPIDPQNALVLRDEGRRQQTLGLAAAAVGAAGIVSGAGMYFFGGRKRVVQSGVALLPGGAAVSIVGEFP